MKKIKNQFLWKITKRDIFILIVCFIIAVIGYFGFENRKEKLKNYKLTNGKVTMHTMTSGKRVGQPEIVCRVTIEGKERLINYETKELKVEVGDCIKIKYSVEDPRINEVVYEVGVVPCDDTK